MCTSTVKLVFILSLESTSQVPEYMNHKTVLKTIFQSQEKKIGYKDKGDVVGPVSLYFSGLSFWLS